MSTEINAPDIMAEVRAVFDRYEAALVGNDVPTLDALFWDSPQVIRFGASEMLYGGDEIRAFRQARPSVGLARDLVRVEIRTFGRDFATTHAEYTRTSGGRVQIGRQTKTLVRMPGLGWQIVSAHVSNMV